MKQIMPEVMRHISNDKGWKRDPVDPENLVAFQRLKNPNVWKYFIVVPQKKNKAKICF